MNHVTRSSFERVTTWQTIKRGIQKGIKLRMAFDASNQKNRLGIETKNIYTINSQGVALLIHYILIWINRS